MSDTEAPRASWETNNDELFLNGEDLMTRGDHLVMPFDQIQKLPGRIGIYTCPLCCNVYKGESYICGKTTIDTWLCTRPKGHEGPCVGCDYSNSVWDHNLDRYYWEYLRTTFPGYVPIPELPPQTEQRLEV